MPSAMEDNVENIFGILTRFRNDRGRHEEIDGADLQEHSGLAPNEINDGVELLVVSGFAEWTRTLGTTPFTFRSVRLTSRGAYEYERGGEVVQDPTAGGARSQRVRPVTPQGSPYGFTHEDWKAVTEKKRDSKQLLVVHGHQFESNHYNSSRLKANVKAMFEAAVQTYNRRSDSIQIALVFSALTAGYGEHLFNKIARDIISSDIAVFETSDLNPNAMIEIGVALTWGVKVLPIRFKGCPPPPSDISGQIWAEYEDDASRFLNTSHETSLNTLVEDTAKKKGS